MHVAAEGISAAGVIRRLMMERQVVLDHDSIRDLETEIRRKSQPAIMIPRHEDDVASDAPTTSSPLVENGLGAAGRGMKQVAEYDHPAGFHGGDDAQKPLEIRRGTALRHRHSCVAKCGSLAEVHIGDEERSAAWQIGGPPRKEIDPTGARPFPHHGGSACAQHRTGRLTSVEVG